MENKLSAIKTELDELRKQSNKMKTESRKGTNEIKLEFRNVSQETASRLDSKLDKIQTQLPVFSNGLSIKIETLQATASNLLLKQEKSDAQLQKIDTKSESCHSILSSVSKKLNNSDPSVTVTSLDLKLEQLSSNFIEFNSSLNYLYVTQLGESISEKVNKTAENTRFLTSIPNLWPMMKAANFPSTLLKDMFGKFEGVSDS